MPLRDYQAEGRKDIFEAWKTDDILMFVLATGGGKTVTFTEIIKELTVDRKRTFLIAHRKELILQAWNTLYNSKLYSGVIMAKYPCNFDLQNQVASIQTLIQRKGLPPVDYLIFDEGHHAQPDNSYGKIIKMFPDAKVLLVTATPYRLSGDGFEYIHSFKKTKLIINRTLKQLTEKGWLVPLKYFIASIPELDQIKTQSGDYEEESAAKAMELAPLVDSYFEHAKGLSGVVFTCNKSHSKKTVEQYLNAGVPAAHLDDETPTPLRDKIIEDFKAGHIKIISNVGIITEGFDMPNMDFVQLARPTKSLSMYLQMVGRVTRPASNCLDGAALDDTGQADRLNRIKQSRKPFGLVLDNAGCYIDHGFPDQEHDWEKYFKGTRKGAKKVTDETMEILIYIAEDENGNKFRTKNPKEIEGLRLVEITKESKKRIVNFTSLKEFDKIYSQLIKIEAVKKPGYIAFNQFMDYCKKRDIMVTVEMWDYLKKKLIEEIEVKVTAIKKEHEDSLEMFKDELHLSAQVEAVRALGVTQRFFTMEYNKYKEAVPAAFNIPSPANEPF